MSEPKVCDHVDACIFCGEQQQERAGYDAAEAENVRLRAELDDWHRGRQESEDVIRRIVELVPRNPRKEDIFQAVRRVVAERETLAAALERFLFFEAALKAKEFTASSVTVAELFDDARAALSSFPRQADEQDETCPDCRWRYECARHPWRDGPAFPERTEP